MGYFDSTNRILGGTSTELVIGAAPVNLAGNRRAFALTVRVTGTIIASINVQDEGGIIRPASLITNSFIGVPLNQGDYIVIGEPLEEIVLTAATDSVILHCDKPY